MQKNIQLYTITILVITYLMPVKIDGYTTRFTIEHLTYIFSHANIFHLMGNCYCAWHILNNRAFSWAITLVTIYIVSILASLVAFNSLPTVGFSAPLFAMIGINFHVSKNKKHFIPMLAPVLASWIFFPLVNTGLHVTCFIMGYLFTLACYKINEIRHDRARIGC